MPEIHKVIFLSTVLFYQIMTAQDVDNEDVNIKKFKKLPRGAFLPKISLDPQVPLKMIDRDMKDLRRFNHIELRDKLLVRLGGLLYLYYRSYF